MALQTGTRVPDFTFQDQDRNETSLRLYSNGSPLYLVFFRYASCPFCNLRIQRMMNRGEEITQTGTKILAVMESTRENYEAYAGKQKPTFPIALDPEHRLYELYELERSTIGLLSTFVKRPGDLVTAMASGFTPGTVDGPMNRMPADFLIDPDMNLVKAHYGKDAGDHMPIPEIIAFAKQYQTTVSR